MERKCECCGAALPLGIDPRTRFCNRYECKILGRRKPVYSEATRRKRSEQMKDLNRRPDVQAKLIAFRASDRCPIRQPENRQKRLEQQRALGFPNLKYDGAPTIPQKLLFDALSGATMEFSLPKSGKTKAFRLDIAIPSLKLAIEVDGLSHTKQKERNRDLRKEGILKDQGWALLRFRNAEVLGDLASVLMRVRATIAVLQKPERVIRHGSVA